MIHAPAPAADVTPLQPDEIVRVSVVITNYNYGRFLRRAVDSVLAQTHVAVECIVVDDGSTDDSHQILADYGDRIRTIYRKNGGQVAAARAGFAISTGSLIIFLDADDYLYPAACASVAAHAGADVAAIQYSLDVKRGTQLLWTFPRQSCPDEEKLAFFLRYGFYPSAPMSGNAFHRSYVEELLARGQHMDGDGFDAYLLYSAPVWGRTITIPESLGSYTIHGDNVSMVSKKTARNLSDHAYYQYWAQQTAYGFLDRRGTPYTGSRLLKGPYNLLWYLVTRNHPSCRFTMPDLPHGDVVAAALRQFATWPEISLSSRIKNMLLVALLGILPQTLRKRVSAQYFR